VEFESGSTVPESTVPVSTPGKPENSTQSTIHDPTVAELPPVEKTFESEQPTEGPSTVSGWVLSLGLLLGMISKC
jgi:hypothetical protein